MVSQPSTDPPGQNIVSSLTPPTTSGCLEIIPSPSKYKTNVDIVAIYSSSNDTELPWVFRPMPNEKHESRSAKTTEKSRKFPTLDDARDLIKDNISYVTKQALTQSSSGADVARPSQQDTGDAREQQQQANNIASKPILSNISPPVKNDGPTLRSGDDAKEVNWVKDLLPGSFPNARIMLCRFEVSSDTTPFVSTLVENLRTERNGTTPDINRPIIFIVDDGASTAIIKALSNTDLIVATVGLMIFCQGTTQKPVEPIINNDILITYIYGKSASDMREEFSNHQFIQNMKLDYVKEEDLEKFRSSEDLNYRSFKAAISKHLSFIPTRRLWQVISVQKDQEGLQAVQEQIRNRADINKKNPGGKTALHLAIGAKNLRIVKLLLQNDANVNIKDDDKLSPILKAIWENDSGIVLALLERGATLEESDRDKVERSSEVADNIKKLLNSITHFVGPSTKNDKSKWIGKSDHDSVPDDCRDAASLFYATVTTFELRCDSGSSAGKRRAEFDASESIEDNETEYRTLRKIQVSELLYGDEGNDLILDDLGDKKWRWYHLPVNNMDWAKALLSRLQAGNEDGRLSGTEHRGPYPHTLFLQPRANVFDRGNYDVTVVFTPYLHSETNEGRVKLRHAIKQKTSGSSASLTDEGGLGWGPWPFSSQSDDDDDDDDDKSNNNDDNVSNYSSYSEDDDDDNSSRESNEEDSDSDSVNDDDQYQEDQSKFNPRRNISQFKKKFKQFRDCIKKYQNNLGDGRSKHDMLINAYFTQETHHLHIRRTLDQFYYMNIKDTDSRDTSQVVQRYAVKELKTINKEATMSNKLIMVDQLWLWILQNKEKTKNIIITSFPQAWHQHKGSNTDLNEHIHKHLYRVSREAITSVNQLASVIIKECTRAFGPLKRSSEPGFSEIFDASISDVNDQLSNIYVTLPDTFPDVEDGCRSHKKAKRKIGVKSSQHNIATEVELLVEIQDIQDELDIIKMVLDEQKSALTVPQDEGGSHIRSKETISYDTFPTIDGKPVDYYVTANMKTVDSMRARAAEVHRQVHNLIDLKQKQANLEEARYAREEATSAAKESKTILALTIVNMLFLPLSFLTSFFSLEITEFPKDPQTGENSLSLAWASKYIFGISLAIAIPSIALALAIGPMEERSKRLWETLKSWGETALLILAVAIVGSIVIVPLLIVKACMVLWRHRPRRFFRPRRVFRVTKRNKESFNV